MELLHFRLREQKYQNTNINMNIDFTNNNTTTSKTSTTAKNLQYNPVDKNVYGIEKPWKNKKKHIHFSIGVHFKN